MNGEQGQQKDAFLKERACLVVTGGHRLCKVNCAQVSSCHDRLSSFILSTLNEYREQSKLVEVGGFPRLVVIVDAETGRGDEK